MMLLTNTTACTMYALLRSVCHKALGGPVVSVTWTRNPTLLSFATFRPNSCANTKAGRQRGTYYGSRVFGKLQ